ncbi:MAG: fibrobacter succinogenes major paralogous domain-containing protein, partial [Dysgonamonadaceae bacterium]|nr:fibrobacter succinogenes major paralogous domain-containing protein [Dysgonamonadaceae bacterium]
TTSNRQGICPDGWTLPSDYDWNQLEKAIATNPGLYSTESDTMTSAAWDSKYENQTDWRPSSGNMNTTFWGRRMKSLTAVSGVTNGMSKTDGTGFNALLVGYFDSGKGAVFGTYTGIWSSSAGSATAAWRRDLFNGTSGAGRNTHSKYDLFSVRCKK